MVTREVEGSTDTLRSADTQPWGKMRRWFRYARRYKHEFPNAWSHRHLLAELRLNQGDGGQSVLIDAGLRPYEVAALAAAVNAHLEGLDSE